MQIEQLKWIAKEDWQTPLGQFGTSAQLVLLFGSRSVLSKKDLYNDVKAFYPQAHIVGCSTAGEICCDQVFDDSLIATAICFEHSQVKTTSITIDTRKDSTLIGEKIGKTMDKKNLVHVFVLSDGLHVNGSALVKGIAKHLPDHVAVTGGLAGDGELFEETLVLCNGFAKQNQIAAVGFYGERLQVSYGSMGGWDPFGPERIITRSDENILYELDGKSALDLYKLYLGEHAEGLPATALLFPLSIRLKDGKTKLVRTILSINPDDQGMVFAGDIPEGACAQFMKANFNRLIDGAIGAAKISHDVIGLSPPDLAILISCVGRKMVLKQRIEEEVEGVREILGGQTATTGFYSYGEISPARRGSASELHNQTMTITTLSER